MAGAIVWAILYGYQLTLHEDCAWDGCSPAQGTTYIGSLFGLPMGVLELIGSVGLVIFVVNTCAKKR